MEMLRRLFKGSKECPTIAEDWKRTTEETRAIWEMVEQDKIDRELLQKAEQQVRRFIEKLEQGIKTRKKTISMLKDLAGELDKTHKDVNIAKVTGTSTAVAGGLITVFGGIASFFTLGLASPLIGVGVATAAAGGATAGGAEIADTVISKNKMEDAQKILDEDKQTLEAIDECYSNLVRTAETISASNPKYGTKEHVLCCLLFSSKLKRRCKINKGQGDLTFTLAAGLLIGIGAILTTTSKEFGALISRLASRIRRVVAQGLARGAGAIARAALRGAGAVATGIFLAFNIYELVKVSQDIHNGSKSQAAATLREIAGNFERQLREMEEFLVEIEKHSEELWELMKKEFRKLLMEIASRKRATREEIKLVLNYLETCQPSEEWWQAFRENVGSLMLYVSCMALIFNALGTKVEEQKKKDEEEGKKIKFMDVTFIAHGGITSPKLPCTLYYMSSPMNILSPGVKSITLYEPWGCDINSKAAYGIATGLININNVQYSDLVLPQLPFSFNTLPYDNTLIPMAVFTPVKTDEGACRELQALATKINFTTRGLVIPYFQPPSDTSLPEIPLWALANDLDVIGCLLDVCINLHVAACLITRDQSLVRQVYPDVPRPVVDCDQYCTVPVTQPPARMSCTLPIPAQYGGLMATLDKLL